MKASNKLMVKFDGKGMCGGSSEGDASLLFCVCGDAATSEAFCLHCYVQDSTGVCSVGAGLACTRAQCGQRLTLFCLLTFHLYLKLKLQVLPGGSSRTRGSCRRGKGRLIPMAVQLDFVIANVPSLFL